MKTLKISFLMLALLVLAGCSNVKVLNSWKSEKVSEFKDNKVLVIARTDKSNIRGTLEIDIAKALVEKGINAKASFAILPILNPDERLTMEQVKNVEEMLKEKGYNGVVISVVKDVKETTNYDSYYLGATMYPSYYGGFYGYYNNPLSYSNYGSMYGYGGGTYVYGTTNKRTYKTYVLETLFYDLDKPEDVQMVAAVTTKISSPTNVEKDVADYTEKIMEALE